MLNLSGLWLRDFWRTDTTTIATADKAAQEAAQNNVRSEIKKKIMSDHQKQEGELQECVSPNDGDTCI